MKYFLLLSLFFAQISFAADDAKEKIILQALYQSLGIDESQTLTPTPAPTEKPLSKGELAIKAQLEANKKKVKEYQEEEKRNPLPSGSMAELRQKNKEWMAGLKKQIEDTRNEWKEKQKIYFKQLKKYKENLVTFEASHPLTSSQLKMDTLKQELTAEHTLINGALSLPIKDQGQRPTCAAFAGIRALETLLKAQGKDLRLSEQYLYWASKPQCQFVPCSSKGSWPAGAFEKSQKAASFDIPSEEDCPYNKNPLGSNETQIPLANRCQMGKVKIASFTYLQNLDETVEALKNNSPVVAGFTLTPNFYKNDGIVKEETAMIGEAMDEHAAGHALLLVGYIKLPNSYQSKEGKICFVAANSWGEGFGKGGFTCLTEKWVLAHRVPNAFIAVKEIKASF